MSSFQHPSRREVFAAVSALGIGTPTFHRAVAAAATGPVTVEQVKGAEWVAGIELTDDQRKQIAAEMTRTLAGFDALHKVPVGNGVPPAVHFDPDPGYRPPAQRPAAAPVGGPAGKIIRPEADDDLAFESVSALARLLRAGKVSSTELTKLYLARLKRYDPVLKCVVTLTEELALKQAPRADKEIAAGRTRGPLHGIPWVAKDLIAYPGYKTTWGAGYFKDQVIDEKATVAARLDESGAVLVAKSTLGSLALGDEWFGGTTRNPWNGKQGSSGSSAGSAAAVAAGLAGFGIGSETLGSIVSPCTRCGVTGLRPTFGRVSRHGCMTLSWSMDKLGPISRTVDDCAVVFAAVHGADGKDATAVDRPFAWPHLRPLKELRVGYTKTGKADDDREELTVLKKLGVKLVPISLPDNLPLDAVLMILTVEASAAFDDVTLAGVTEGLGIWPGMFRHARFVPAVEYLRAQRVRTLLMRRMAKVMEAVDLYVGGNDLLITNLTGHPTVVLPNGFRKSGGVETPTSLTFTGRLWGESALLAVATAYQNETGHHLKRPDMSKVAKAAGEEK